MSDALANSNAEPYVIWNISAERQRHEWMRLRKSIVATRMRIVIGGHALFFAACLVMSHAGIQCAMFVSAGWWSLVFVSAYLLAVEYIHVRMLPTVPPRFVIRKCGLTKYGNDGPQSHWDWCRAGQLSIETDCLNPAYRSLVVTLKSNTPWMQRLNRFNIPLPECEKSDGAIRESDIVAAVKQALDENGIAIQPRHDGTVALIPSAHEKTPA